MITFAIIAAVMLAAACAWVLAPLLRRREVASIDRDASNLAVLRDQRAELEADLANGVISAEQYERARAELDRRVIEEARPEETGGAMPARSSARTAAIVAAAMPIAAVVLYLLLGTPIALSPEARQAAAAQDEAHATSPQQIDAMVERVKEKLARDPNNVEGWVVLARTYYATGRANDAVQAFERATALAPDDAGLLADYADALGVAQGRSLEGKPAELIERAVNADPNHWKANALAGTIAFNRKQYAKAAEYWERVKSGVPPGSPIAESIDGSIAQARELGGLGPAKAATAPSGNSGAAKTAAPGAMPTTGAASSGAAAPAGALVAGTVTLAPALANAAQPEDTLYIFARAAQGPRGPLALIRKRVKDLPFAFRLDDSMAMAPNMKLSDFGEVVVGARVAKSGQAAPQSGDLEGISPTVKLGTQGLALVIDRTIP